jgi:hypothetical protein
MDGTVRLQLADNSIHHVSRTEGKSTVHKDGSQSILRNASLKRQQRAELRVAILLDDKTEIVAVEKLFHALVERETADAHVVRVDTALLE